MLILTVLSKGTPKYNPTHVLAFLFIFFMSGCATLPRNPVPLDQVLDAEVVHAPGVRAWGGRVSSVFQEDIIKSLSQESEDDFLDPVTRNKSYNALAISGGGSDGAFGAGFLYGWTVRGDRPVFKLVSGISTGALIAPFAFLGSEYDEQLKEVYTNVNTEQIISRISIMGILTKSESFTESTPLVKLIKKNFDLKMMSQVAAEHNKGRRLYIGTTHMDAQRLVVWNMGLIAKIGTGEALDIFQKVLLASASIPVAMPPVYFDIEIDGNYYDEMHTDGGTTTQVFFHAGTIDLVKAGRSIGLENNRSFSKLYIIRNGQITPVSKLIPRNLHEISARTIDTSIKAAALNNLFRMYVFANKEQSKIFYAGIPDEFIAESNEPFDKEEMRRLFGVGMQLGASPNPWNDKLPGLNSL